MEFIERTIDTKIGEKWAVIIGISKYQEFSLKLEYADRDAQDFYDILTQEKDGFFKKDNIMKLINEDATARNINKALKNFLKKPDTDDLVLIYFACHGAYDPDRPKNTYLLPYDTERDDIAGTGVDMSEIDNSIKNNLLAKKIIVIADACHSAAIGGDFARRRSMQSPEIVNKFLQDIAAAREGTALLTSAEASEVALEGEQWGDGHGVFTHFLIQGIKGEADGFGGKEKDGIISIGELFEYVRHMVKKATNDKQHPLIGSSPFDRRLPLIYLESVKEEFAELENQITSEINQGNYVEVNNLSDKMMALDPKNHLSYFYKGLGDELSKKYGEAIQNYDKVIDMKADYEVAYYRKGQVLKSLDNKEQAKLCFEKAVEIKPTYYEAIEAKQALIVEIAKDVRSQDNISPFESVEPNRAIVIGINEYENSDIPVLEAAENDAIELRKILMNPNLGFRIADNHFLTGRQATYDHIRQAMYDLLRKYTDASTNLILFYISGHGFVDTDAKQGYLVTYDFDPDYPEFFGISMELVRKLAFASKTRANILMILDCSYSGIVTKGIRGVESDGKKIYADEVVLSSQSSQDSNKCVLLIASSEADTVSRNKTECVDEANHSAHTHGAFSYYLIRGLHGDAANKIGLITLESLQKYLEDQMLAVGKQRPLHSFQGSRPDKVIIGKSMSVYMVNIQEIIINAKEYSTKDDLRSLRVASKYISELQELEKDNPEVPKLIENVNDTLENMHARELITEWLKQNESKEFMYVSMMIEQIQPGLYDRTFYDIVEHLSYESLRDMDNRYFQYLVVLYHEAKNNSTYPNRTSAQLIRLINRLKEISQHPN